MRALANKLGIENIPESWIASWPELERWILDGKCEEPVWKLPENAANVFDLPHESLQALEDIYAAIRVNDDFRRLADFWHFMVYHLPEGMERNTNTWHVPDMIQGYPTRLFSLAVVVSGTDHALENFVRTGVSEEVTRLTLGYIGYYTRDIRKKRGVWGLESLGWLSNYVRATIFRLGRLTFKAGIYALPFRAFKNRRTGQVMMLCESSARFRTDGLADGTNGIFDPNAWSPVLEMNKETITGCLVSSDHTAAKEPITLAFSEWEQILERGTEIVEVHIAGGSKLFPEECADSYKQAVQFFPEYYPQSRFAGFTCWSWLLDPGLAKILPAESNIAKFQKSFHITPVASNESQAYDLVFGDSSADPAKVPHTTYLQRAIAEYVAAGNKMTSAAGFIAWEEALALGAAL